MQFTREKKDRIYSSLFHQSVARRTINNKRNKLKKKLSQTMHEQEEKKKIEKSEYLQE